ncbi:MAG TPA: SulP family inorganic anion transporter, partial [Allocoleopsis sp.]
MNMLFPVRWVLREFQPQYLIPSLISGLISGVLNITVAISMGVLIFSGDLSPYQPIGIGMGLFANVVTGLGIGMTSSYAPLLAGLDELPIVVLAAVVGSIAATMAATITPGVDEPSQRMTLLMAILLMVVLTGAIAWLLGHLRLGNLVRFIPYPVIGGFLAGIGWFMVQGGFLVILDQPLALANLPVLMQSPLVRLWIPGLVFAIALTILTRRYSHWAIFPGCLMAA